MFGPRAMRMGVTHPEAMLFQTVGKPVGGKRAREADMTGAMAPTKPLISAPKERRPKATTSTTRMVARKRSRFQRSAP